MLRYVIALMSLLLLPGCAVRLNKKANDTKKSSQDGATAGVMSIFAPEDLAVPANLTQLDKAALAAELSQHFAASTSDKTKSSTLSCFDRITKKPAVATAHTLTLRTFGTIKNCDVSNPNTSAPTVIRSASVDTLYYMVCASRDLSMYDGTIVKSESDVSCPREDLVVLSEASIHIEYGVTFQGKEYNGELNTKTQMATKDGKPCGVAHEGSCIETYISVASAFKDAIGKLLDGSLKDRTIYSQYTMLTSKKSSAGAPFAFDRGSVHFSVNQWQQGVIDFTDAGASWSAFEQGRKEAGALTPQPAALLEAELPSIPGLVRRS